MDNIYGNDYGESMYDITTKAGTYRMIRTTLGEYLTQLDLYDPLLVAGFGRSW